MGEAKTHRKERETASATCKKKGKFPARPGLLHGLPHEGSKWSFLLEIGTKNQIFPNQFKQSQFKVATNVLRNTFNVAKTFYGL